VVEAVLAHLINQLRARTPARLRPENDRHRLRVTAAADAQSLKLIVDSSIAIAVAPVSAVVLAANTETTPVSRI
jgi:hypothetical protein